VWLEESLRRVREVFDVSTQTGSTDVCGELERLLHLPGDGPGWLRAALECPAPERRASPLPAVPHASEGLIHLVSLRCALAAGLAALDQLHASRTTLGQAFDDAETGMAIFGDGGRREVARNARLAEVLREEPARERLLELMERLAEQTAASPGEAGKDCRELELDLTDGSYRLVASRVAAGKLLPDTAVLILVDRLSPALPTTQELRIGFGLRGREPQVALLAAEGLSNAAIAERLRLSAHTVRHYLERVLDRLGLHSRKALALHLMAGGGERPSPTKPPGSLTPISRSNPG
jgi:DNA-binding CsgD family transcriptional regulator